MPSSKDHDSSHGTKLLQLFLKFMLEGKRHYQADLAKRFSCSPQTIIRLVAEIESVVGDSLVMGTENRRRFYQLKSFSQRRTLGLDFEELRYLSICRDLAAPYLPSQVTERVEKTIFALSTLLADPDYAERANVQKQQVGFKSKGFIDYTPHFKTIGKLIHAAEDRLVCVIDYRANGKREPKTHLYAPGHILSMNGALYIQGYQVTKGAFEKDRPMTLSIHRVINAVVTDEHFDFDATYDRHGSFGMRWHDPKRYRIRIAPGATDYVRERIWSEDQVIEEQADGGLILDVSTVSDEELKAWVRSFGENAEIISSATLRTSPADKR